MFWDFTLLIVLIAVSSFFSGSEMAYVVANKIKIEIRARKNNLAAQSAFYFIRNPKTFFPTILIGNNVVNIAFASISTLFLSSAFGMDKFSILLISTFLILLFGELLPKYLSREAADDIILLSAIPLRILSIVFYPFIKILSSLFSFISQTENVKEESFNYLFSREDMKTLIDESREAGIVNQRESDIISKVLALSDQRVYEAMRPRTEIVGIETGMSVEEILDLFIDSGFSKLPVYEENLDNIKGVIYAYDLFNSPKDIQSITREVAFIPETKKSYEMLNEFLNKRVSIAVVIDEFGGTAGIVTTEDIIEELFGEIKDEYDVEEYICRRIRPDTYLISGMIEIDYLNEKYDLKLPQGDYETVAGFIIEKTGRIPNQGENVLIGNFNFLIARAVPSKIELVRLTVTPQHQDEV
ncbi:MAG: HlyC/CorC family transporter [Ignavibacteriales bacterium]|nr:MAG: HlyC/CorC family transporter [Ignavibacteriales bacterium]